MQRRTIPIWNYKEAEHINFSGLEGGRSRQPVEILIIVIKTIPDR
jgi:hypothetical protein